MKKRILLAAATALVWLVGCDPTPSGNDGGTDGGSAGAGGTAGSGGGTAGTGGGTAGSGGGTAGTGGGTAGSGGGTAGTGGGTAGAGGGTAGTGGGTAGAGGGTGGTGGTGGSAPETDAGYFIAYLSSSQETAMVFSPQRGMAEVWLTQLADGGFRERWLVTHTFDAGIPTAAHIHHGSILGANASNLTDFGSTLASPIQGSAAADTTKATALQNESAYVNIHTAANTGGEVRGQLMQAGFGAAWAKLYTDDPMDGGVLAGSVQLSLPLVDAGMGNFVVFGTGRARGRLAAGYAAASARVAYPDEDGGFVTMHALQVSADGGIATSTFFTDGGQPPVQPMVEVVLTDGGALYGVVEVAF